MDFLELAKQRTSIRKYEARSIEKEKIDRIIEAGHVAPTAANKQPVRLFVVTSKDVLASVDSAIATTIYDAPLAIIACVDTSKAWVRPVDGFNTSDTDAAILTDHMMLAATAEGLGSVWISYFRKEELKQALGLPKHLEPINVLAIGYSTEKGDPNRHQRTRISLTDFVSYK